MSSRASQILTINSGSSSIKFAIFDQSQLQANGLLSRTLSGQIDGIGSANAKLSMRGADASEILSQAVSVPDNTAAAKVLLEAFHRRKDHPSLTAIGHRIVNGGATLSQPEVITPSLLNLLSELSPFDPTHMPSELELIRSFMQQYPDIPHVACFDTAFHHDLPLVAKLVPIPRKFYALGVRRFGFHGLSYSFLMDELARTAGSEASQGKIVLAHLGNGASLAAVRNGRPVDTTMGFTPCGGVPMGTRAGDLDPGLMYYLEKEQRLSSEELFSMVNSESGLLGLSETSSDVRALLKREAEDVRAAEALNVFCYSIKKQIGALTAAMGGLETLVFAGGIGENSSIIRQRICEGLGFLGMEISSSSNSVNAGLISTNHSRVTVRVIRTDEEQMIAKSVARYT